MKIVQKRWKSKRRYDKEERYVKRMDKDLRRRR